MKFSEFIDVRDGTHSSPKPVKTGYSLVTTKNLKMNFIDFESANKISKKDYVEINKRSLVEQYDILLSMIGTVGNVYQERNLDPNYAIKNVALLKFHGDEVLSNWMNYYLQSYDGKNLIFSRLSGSTQQFISLNDLRSLDIKLPTRKVMVEKVKPLRDLDKKIMLNQQVNDNLMKLNTLLFQQLSVDSDYTLSNFTDCQNGFAFKSSEYITNNELLILRTLNMTSDHLFSKNGVKYISKVYKEKYQKFEFKKFDTTLVMVGASIGKMALITTNVIPSLQNQNMWRFRSKSKMPGLLIYDMVQYVNDRVRSSATGSARSFYRKKMFLNSKVPVISEKYYDIFLAIQEKINNIANENETLSNLKNVLLSKYF